MVDCHGGGHSSPDPNACMAVCRHDNACYGPLEGGGPIERPMAGHESPKTTKLYDRTSDETTLDDVEWIAVWDENADN